ncbi:MAG: succinate dehydrogenase/fumarate reductase iron-sulfur subunit [bacterium]
MRLTLEIWRQRSATERGEFARYEVPDVSPDSSFLEMLDVLNEQLIEKGEEPVAFDHDCREGICGMCSLVVNGVPHGPERGTTVCQLHMRHFRDGETIVVEPWRAKAFPVLRDLVVDRTAFDRIIQAGGYVSINTGGAPDANAVPIAKEEADLAFDSATCIGCGACVAACRNASAMLFVGAKVTQFLHLPQGQPERRQRALAMVEKMDDEGFGRCSNHYECEAACPKEISRDVIRELNREFLGASLTRRS